MTRVIATAADVGRSCPYCRFPLKEGSAAERCDSCSSLHHEDCWSDGGGCAVLGCASAGVATAAAPAGPQAGWSGPAYQQGAPPTAPQAPPTQAYPGYGAPPGYPPPPPAPPTPPRSGNQAVLAIAVIIALLGIGTGVAVATGAFSNSAHTNTPPSTVATTASRTTPTTATTSLPSPGEQANDRQAIMSILGTYQSSYSDHDISGLSNIFTPGISRHGLAAGGCTVSRGRGAVLADYQSQFEEGSGSYELVGLSAGQIQLESKTRAHLDAHYQITPGGSGYVNFKFAEIGEGWKISEVYATCE
jgi:hypothetical protein